jgi:hypothetical protein
VASLDSMNDQIKKVVKGDVISAIRDKFNERLQALLGEKDFDSNRILRRQRLWLSNLISLKRSPGWTAI